MRTFLCALLVLVGTDSLVLAQGRLSDVREDIRSDPPPSPPKKERHQKPHCDEDEDSFLSSFLGGLLGAIFSGNCGDQCDNEDRQSETTTYASPPAPPLAFPTFPYPLGMNGYMQVDPTPVNANEVLYLKNWALQSTIDYGTNFNGFHKLTGQFLLETKSRLGVQTNWHYLYEELDCGCADDAALGSIYLTYRLIQDKNLLVRSGLGGQLFTDAYGTNGGFAAMLAADVFPVRPLVVSGLVEGGSLGHTGIIRTRISAGTLWKGLEIHAGYEFLQIGSTNFHMPIAGLRLWF